MKQTLQVNIDNGKNYLIEISDNSFEKLNRGIDEATKGQKRLIVISKKVYDLYYTRLNFSEDELFILKDGEKEKNYKNYLKIIEKAVELGLTRKDAMVAVGGGVAGDLTGFAASTYMRGIDFIQVPTTLLSAVDSSVGGKTAIDLAEAKNIIGTFYQPKAVFININFLNTLDKRQFMSGLGEVLKYAFILRRMKRDVAKDLPDKVENMAYCELTDEQRDFYLEVLDSTKEELFKSIELNGLEKSRMSIFSALLRLRQICCHPKLYDKEHVKGVMKSGKFEYLKGMLEQVIQEKHRVLLFSQFVDMLDIIKGWLEREGIPYEYLTGKTKDRQAAVENFNNNPNIPIFLISLKAGGTGLNLTGADYVIHYDPWWNPAVEDQATDRAYRIGQTKKVFVYRLITKNTVEEKIQKIKGRKRDLVDSVVSIDRNITKSLTMEDLRDIFSVD